MVPSARSTCSCSTGTGGCVTAAGSTTRGYPSARRVTIFGTRSTTSLPGARCVVPRPGRSAAASTSSEVITVAAMRRPADVRGGPALTARLSASHDLLPAIAIVAAAWTALLALDVTGVAATLHHHALIEGGPPLWIAIPLFLLAWQVMVAAMMVPASLPAIRWVTPVAARFGALGAQL